VTLPHSYQAGIYRETLEYWLRRSAAGYDIEWQEIEWRFHEHCASAIDQADDSLRWRGLFLEWQRPEKWASVGRHTFRSTLA
jgi:hypothetical protein